MKSMLFKNAIKTIGKTKGRFFSILAIVAVGVAFFSGVLASAPNMKYNADLYFDEYNLMDYQIMSNFGLTDEDIQSLEKIDGIEGIMPAYSADVLANINDKESVIKVHSLDIDDTSLQNKNYINQIVVEEGRLPTKSGECIVEQSLMVEDPIEIGDTITIRSGTDDDINDTFNTTSFKVVGLMHSPYYLSYQKGSSNIGGGTVNYYMYVPSEDFALDVYTEAYLTVEGAKKYNSYSQSYFDYIEDITNELENLGIERSEIRRADILNEAQTELDKYQKEYEEGLQTYNEEISNAEKQIEDGKLELLEGRLTLQSKKDLAESQFASSQVQIETNKQQLAMISEELAKVRAEYDSQNAQMIAQKEEAQKQLDEASKQEETAQQAYDAQNVIYTEYQTASDNLTAYKTENTILETDNTTQQLLIDTNNKLLEDPNLTEENRAQLEQQIVDANNKISENNTKINENNVKIEEINAKYPNLNEDLTNASIELARCETELQAYQAQVSLLEQTIAGIDEGLAASKQVLDELQQKVDSYNQQIVDGENQLATQKAQAEVEFANAQKELENATYTLAQGEIELEKQKQEGQEKLDEAYDELVKAQDQIDQIGEARWYVLDRHSHYSYVDYEGASDRIEAIAKVFPVFFYFVAALVCLTTMTRMVDEERSEIGTLKALGYSNGKIAFKYVFYAAIASVIGSILGLLVGVFAFPYIIYTAWNMMYLLPSQMHFEMQWDIMITATILSVLITTIASFSSCYKSLVEVPSELMRPKAPKVGKKILLERITFIWKRLSFTSKVTCRNIFRYKKRFIMTVVGISGCTALIVAGFGIKDSINTIVDKQFGEIFKYNGVVTIDDSLSNSQKDELVLEIENSSSISDAFLTYTANGTLTFDGESRDVTITVIDDNETFKDFIDLHERKTNKPLALSTNGIIITERMANALNIGIGDVISLENVDGMTRDFTVDGICENYVNHYVFMTSATFKNTYDIRAVNNSILLKVIDEYQNDDSVPAKQISQLNGVETLTFNTSIRTNFEDMIKSLDYIVVVLIISAGALAFVVLYNLTNVNISERTREIATLMVLGFNNKEVNHYIYNENILLTLIGSIVGLGLGKLLHLTIMVVVELDYIMFGRIINNISYVYAVIITLVFAFIVNQVMKKKLRNIPMVESLKSVE